MSLLDGAIDEVVSRRLYEGGLDPELKSIVAHWNKEAADKTLTSAEVKDGMANDLEQLEYSPNLVKLVLPRMVQAVKIQHKN